MTAFRRGIRTAVLLIGVVVAAAVPLANAQQHDPPASWWGPGQWRRPAISGLPPDGQSAKFTEEHTVFGKLPAPVAAPIANGSAAASDALWADLTTVSRTGPRTARDDAAVEKLVEQGYVAVVTMLRNPAAQGWDFFSIARAPSNTSSGPAVANISEEAVAYAAGFVEGAVTYLSMYAYFSNTVAPFKHIYDVGMGKTPSPPDTRVPTALGAAVNASCLAHFVADHVAFERAHEATSGRGAELRRNIRQMDGLVAGWNRRHQQQHAAGGAPAAEKQRNVLHPVEVAEALDFVSVYLMNYLVEVFDVVAFCVVTDADNGVGQAALTARARPKPADGHCSVLWKLTDADLLASHGTWYLYASMTRQYKTYNFSATSASSLQMSSYPGAISSNDDWYVTGHGLLVTETTLSNANVTAMRDIVPDAVSTFQRALIASRLAASPEEWAAVFTEENSGTCSNQWMIAQMRWASEDFAVGSGDNNNNNNASLRPGTFWVLEQAPGLVVAAEQTAHLRRDGYWASYNSAFYPRIKARLGDEAPHDSRGDIFARMQGSVTNATDAYYLVRYNNFAHDKLSTNPACRTPWTPNGTDTTCTVSTNLQDATRAIAARADLSAVNRALYGETDVKVASASSLIRHRSRIVAQLGPTSVQQPAFVYSAFVSKYPAVVPKNASWVGLPDRFDFTPLFFDASGALAASLVNGSNHTATGAASRESGGAPAALVWAVCFVALAAVSAIAVIAAVGLRRRHRGTPVGDGDWELEAAQGSGGAAARGQQPREDTPLM